MLGKDENYLPESPKKHRRGCMSLDDTEAWLTALAEAQKTNAT